MFWILDYSVMFCFVKTTSVKVILAMHLPFSANLVCCGQIFSFTICFYCAALNVHEAKQLCAVTHLHVALKSFLLLPQIR